MLWSHGAARVVMSWRGNRATNELKVDRKKNARRAHDFAFLGDFALGDLAQVAVQNSLSHASRSGPPASFGMRVRT